MPQQEPPSYLGILSHDIRWSILQLLRHQDLRVKDLVDAIEAPINLVSYHLKALKRVDLVNAHRSDIDGRDVFYSLNYTTLQGYIEQLSQSFNLQITVNDAGKNATTPLQILFLCTYNTTRSQIAEGLTRQLADERLIVYSAGLRPQTLSPQLTQFLEAQNLNTQQHWSKPVTLYQNQNFDVVITLSDDLRFPDHYMKHQGIHLHWSYRNPDLEIPDHNRLTHYHTFTNRIRERIQLLLNSL